MEELPTDKMIRALYLMNELSCVNGLEFPKNKYGYESVAFTELQDYYFWFTRKFIQCTVGDMFICWLIKNSKVDW